MRHLTATCHRPPDELCAWQLLALMLQLQLPHDPAVRCSLLIRVDVVFLQLLLLLLLLGTCIALLFMLLPQNLYALSVNFYS